MMDKNSPLTKAEYSEWGDPSNLNDYNIIKEYSPIHNLPKTWHTKVLLTAQKGDLRVSLHDMKIYVKKLNEISIKTNIAELKLISNQHSNILKMHIDFLIENINK